MCVCLKERQGNVHRVIFPIFIWDEKGFCTISSGSKCEKIQLSIVRKTDRLRETAEPEERGAEGWEFNH